MTHIPDHLAGDSPLARWWVALEGVRREVQFEAPRSYVADPLWKAAKHIRLAMDALEEKGRS